MRKDDSSRMKTDILTSVISQLIINIVAMVTKQLGGYSSWEVSVMLRQSGFAIL